MSAPFDYKHFWQHETIEHLEVAKKSFESLSPVFEEILEITYESLHNGGKLMFFGNGGSAADAQHLATECAVRYVKDRKPIRAVALTTDTSALTAIGNDYGFDHLFARQIDALGQGGDVAIGISTSGTSPNVLEGLKAARAKNIKTIGFTGRDGGEMGHYCDVTLIIPSDVTARIQEMHITLGQMLCGALEKKLGLVE